MKTKTKNHVCFPSSGAKILWCAHSAHLCNLGGEGSVFSPPWGSWLPRYKRWLSRMVEHPSVFPWTCRQKHGKLASLQPSAAISDPDSQLSLSPPQALRQACFLASLQGWPLCLPGLCRGHTERQPPSFTTTSFRINDLGIFKR